MHLQNKVPPRKYFIQRSFVVYVLDSGLPLLLSIYSSHNAGPGKQTLYVRYLTYSWKQPLEIRNQERPHFTGEETEIRRG